ncbi:MAG: cold shock domain-containing protein [Desulfobacteraceae bacterium]|nr:MAG: cold shock domain-containing protein [Desulfobacteraceae bacterium]
MRYQGKVTRWNEDRGFGFISPNGSRNLVFIHIRAFINTPQRPVLNELVNYELSDEQNGRARAENVTFASDDALDGASTRRWPFRVIMTAVLFIFVAVSAAGIIYLNNSGRFPVCLGQTGNVLKNILNAVHF